MTDIINDIKNSLIESGATGIYSTFDALPVAGKGDIFTVIGIKNLSYSTPVYSQYMIYMPFRAELEIKILAPESTSVEKIFSYYESVIGRVISQMVGLNSSISGMSVKPDKNIGRLVLTVSVSVGGIRKIEREAEEQE
ncbi:MAG: hypothetical protein NC340_01635 [Ruminococcus flavefaciens]|nr:hypothetical protein [Ruminococcus flavefaciens]MCM1228848.1 hypothetical protein [Ruminococcus flavefaciens]